jgi:hypothetical protein
MEIETVTPILSAYPFLVRTPTAVTTIPIIVTSVIRIPIIAITIPATGISAITTVMETVTTIPIIVTSAITTVPTTEVVTMIRTTTISAIITTHRIIPPIIIATTTHTTTISAITGMDRPTTIVTTIPITSTSANKTPGHTEKGSGSTDHLSLFQKVFLVRKLSLCL